MDKMINWLSSDVTTPDPGRSIVAKNSTKIIFDKASGGRCLTVVCSPYDTKEDIADTLEMHGYDLWAYTDEGDQHE